PEALICSIASFSACTDPVSLMAMVPVTEWSMPTLTVLSVTARPVVLTSADAVAKVMVKPAAKANRFLVMEATSLVLFVEVLMVYRNRKTETLKGGLWIKNSKYCPRYLFWWVEGVWPMRQMPELTGLNDVGTSSPLCNGTEFE